MTSMYSLVYFEEPVKPAAERRVLGAAKVWLYLKTGDNAAYPTGLPRNRHCHSLPCYSDRDMDVIRATDIIAKF